MTLPSEGFRPFCGVMGFLTEAKTELLLIFFLHLVVFTVDRMDIGAAF